MRLPALLAVLTTLATGAAAVAQDPGVEVLARGPVHEAYAATAEHPTAGPVVAKMPPTPIEELPPDQKPEGSQWVPGYWHWDEDRTDFIWISGFWRVPPPGRVWMPGSWREVRGGFQWVHGFWQSALPQAQQQELEYLPPPPAQLELAPSVPSPSETCFYVPGSWTWRGRYVWRPGFWVEHRPNWVWVPTHYRWTPAGHVCVEGYWDHPLDTRGVLFAPVYVAPAVYSRPAFVYTPSYAVSHHAMFSAMFVRRGYGNYYFGDYFEPRYTTVGFNAWCGTSRGGNFAISVGIGRAHVYDPLWSYYQHAYRNDPVWVNNVTNLYVGRYRGDVARPPRTLVQQNTVVNNITNVTNVTNVTNNVTNVTMVAPLQQVAQANSAVALKTVKREERQQEAAYAKQLTQVGTQRRQAETSLADRQLAPTQQTDKPRQVKLDVPQQVVARAQAPTPTAKAPPPLPAPNQVNELKQRGPATIPPIQTEPTKPMPQPTKPGLQQPVTPNIQPPAQPAKPIQQEPQKPRVTVLPPTPTLPTPKPVTPAPATPPKQVEKPQLPPPAAPRVTIPPPSPPPTVPPAAKPASLPPPKQVEKPQLPAPKPAPATPPPAPPRQVEKPQVPASKPPTGQPAPARLPTPTPPPMKPAAPPPPMKPAPVPAKPAPAQGQNKDKKKMG